MLDQPLSGEKIGVIVESKFIPEEILAYQHCFSTLGATVELISRICYEEFRPEEARFLGDVDPLDDPPWTTAGSLKVRKDISTVDLSEYAALIMSANYTSVRLRYTTEKIEDLRAYAQSAPASKKFAEAMANKSLIKGALCHGLWILTPYPELLRGRRVVCNPVVLADILNCNAEVTLADKVVVDDDLVTGFSKHEVVEFALAIARAIRSRRT